MKKKSIVVTPKIGSIWRFWPVPDKSFRCPKCGFKFGTDAIKNREMGALVKVIDTSGGIAECPMPLCHTGCDFQEAGFIRAMKIDTMQVAVIPTTWLQSATVKEQKKAQKQINRTIEGALGFVIGYQVMSEIIEEFNRQSHTLDTPRPKQKALPAGARADIPKARTSRGRATQTTPR